MRSLLNGIYAATGALAGIFLVAIAGFILAQILGRLLGTAVPSADEFAGYSMAASAFLGAAYTFRSNGHVRIQLVTERLPATIQRWMERIVLLLAALALAYGTWHAGAMAWESYVFEEKTQGMLPIPLWVPQTGLLAGLATLTLAILDDLVVCLLNRQPSYWRDTTTSVSSSV